MQVFKKNYCRTSSVLLGLFIVTAHADIHSIERIQVTSSRSIVTEKDNSYHLVSEADIFSYQPADVLIQIPGISFNGQGGQFQSYSIRGMSRQRIRTEFDGIPIFSERRAGSSLSFIPMGFVQSIEAIKGPQSTLYGPEAMGGIVSFQPWRQAQTELKYALQADSQGHSLLFRTEQQQRYYAASFRQANNSKAADGTELHTEFSQKALLFAERRQVNNIDIHLSMVLSDNKDIGKSNKKYPNEITLYPDETHMLAQVTLKHPSGWQWQTYHHYQNWDSLVTRSNNQRETDYQAHTVGSVFRQPWDYHSVSGQTGIEWIGRHGVRVKERIEDEAIPLVHARQDTLGIFSEALWDLSPWQLGLGVRFDQLWQHSSLPTNVSTQQHRLSGHASIQRELHQNWHGHYKVASGFRFASLSERFFTGDTPRGKTAGNPSLLPESIINQELGIKYHDRELSFEVAAFRTRVQNYIERYRVNPDLRSFRNLETGVITGAEAQLTWQTPVGVQTAIGAHTQRGSNQDGLPLADLSAAVLQHQLLYKYQRHHFQLSSRYRFPQNRVASSETSLPSVLLFDLSYQFKASSRLHAGLKIKNVTNQLFQGSADSDAYWQPGRQFQLDISWIFQ